MDIVSFVSSFVNVVVLLFVFPSSFVNVDDVLFVFSSSFVNVVSSKTPLSELTLSLSKPGPLS